MAHEKLIEQRGEEPAFLPGRDQVKLNPSPHPRPESSLQTLPHPTFSKEFLRLFLRAWGINALLFVGAVVPYRGALRMLGLLLAIAFGSSMLGTLAYLFYRLHHTHCPQCDEPMKTRRGRASYVATCCRCATTWDLGIGIGGVD